MIFSYSFIFIFSILISVLNKEYIQNIYYKISESYILDSFNKIRDRKKFGNIEYLKTNDFLNKYGYGSNNQENITNIIIYNFLLSIFWILLVFIFHYKFKNSKMGNHIRRFFEDRLKKAGIIK